MINWYTLGPRQTLFAYSKRSTPRDDELSHEYSLQLLAALQKHAWFLDLLATYYRAGRESEFVEVAGIQFRNRIGLSAGLDKNGLLPLIWQALGFGFAEIGTILPHYQKGNERPRIFRIEELEALINRLGFNSEGAEAVLRNLQEAQKIRNISIPLGINISKMKETPDEVEPVVHDCTETIDKVRSFAAYKVFNVSSPNTPGLRDLQGKLKLRAIVEGIVSHERKAVGPSASPLFVKVDIDGTALETQDRFEAAREGGAQGIIIGNTTIRRPRGWQLDTTSESTKKLLTESGGFSGIELNFIRAIDGLKCIRKIDKNFPVIFVSAVNSPNRYNIARSEGADLLQVLTPFVYQGPPLLWKLRQTEIRRNKKT